MITTGRAGRVVDSEVLMYQIEAAGGIRDKHPYISQMSTLIFFIPWIKEACRGIAHRTVRLNSGRGVCGQRMWRGRNYLFYKHGSFSTVDGLHME